jgi:hypothetical protein
MVFWTFLLAVVTGYWLLYGVRVGVEALRLPWLEDIEPAADSDCPSVSLLFTARDEAEKLPQAVASFLALDYPRLEIVAVNDRSQDATGEILQAAAENDPRLKVLQVRQLPPGWLGKPHGLQKAYEQASGDWLVFTDADVWFAPDVLRRAVTLAQAQALDHLTLFGRLEMRGFWEKVALTFFGLGFHFAARPGRAADPDSKSYVGVGAFQMVRRAAYEASGTHRRLALEVVDDMKLGKIIKQAGFRSGAAVAGGKVRVRWYDSIGGLAQGVTKNFFAGAGYNLRTVALQTAGLLVFYVLPFVALLAASGWDRALAAVAALAAVVLQGGVCWGMGVSPLYGLTHPLGALIFIYLLLRSTVVTLRRGGVIWRGTFYPLEELRKGVV